MLENTLKTALATYRDPYLEKDLFTAKAVRSLRVQPDEISIEIALPYPCALEKEKIAQDLLAILTPASAGKKMLLNIHTHIESHQGKPGMSRLPNIKNIIAVGSGKGGVGKSTMALHLALALKKEGAKVGLLDADIYGPSQPALLGAQQEKPVIAEGKLQPIFRHGIASMSMGYLIDTETPMVWRGPMLGKALQQLLNDTLWEDLDYLIIDLPPGTGDVPLTLCQKMPVTGAVLVTTPQDLALLDVRRAAEMFRKLDVPLLGVIENMSYYHCPQCGHEDFIFGQDGGKKLSAQYAMPLLGSVPLDAKLRAKTDSGFPCVIEDEDNPYSQIFFKIACKTAATLALQPKDFSAKFPKIVVE